MANRQNNSDLGRWQMFDGYIFLLVLDPHQHSILLPLLFLSLILITLTHSHFVHPPPDSPTLLPNYIHWHTRNVVHVIVLQTFFFLFSFVRSTSSIGCSSGHRVQGGSMIPLSRCPPTAVKFTLTNQIYWVSLASELAHQRTLTPT